ncbi:hypothetical protein [Saccharospirillum salsuginis]|uniref:DUF1127 domain-containing protein n=1 Tax=Saccharospirillum salsuginis TaxID=418750 RepID=A0A918NGT1_9GAMM|nr:hypothetical protein [Saccharospirillum salsuginis]GGX66524.1 hypothetical protein GCM10007392_37790 [Saccharospirillum salsuginis]
MNTASNQCHNALVDCASRLPEATQPLLQRIKATLKVWQWRHKVRSQLRADMVVMDIARIEKDTGLPTGALRQEAYKPFWKA